MTRAATMAALSFLAAACTMAQAPATDAAAAPPAELALEVVAGHLSVEKSELELVHIEPVEWRDSSIGCPDPGMDYPQVITPGHFALVRDAKGMTHRVHMAGGHGIVCDQAPIRLSKDSPPPAFSRSHLEALARADLALRLDVPAQEIAVVAARPVEWSDGSLGCGADDEMPAGEGSKGFVLTLAHAGRQYTYHTDLRQAIPCPPIETR